MPIVTGVVEQIGQKDGVPTGVKVKGEWWNYSKPQYRKDPWYEPKVGDMVQFEAEEPKGDFKTGFVRTMKLAVEGARETNGASGVYREGHFDRDRSIIAQVCIKAAVHLVVPSEHKTVKERGEAAMFLAGLFEEWIQSHGAVEPEPTLTEELEKEMPFE